MGSVRGDKLMISCPLPARPPGRFLSSRAPRLLFPTAQLLRQRRRRAAANNPAWPRSSSGRPPAAIGFKSAQDDGAPPPQLSSGAGLTRAPLMGSRHAGRRVPAGRVGVAARFRPPVPKPQVVSQSAGWLAGSLARWLISSRRSTQPSSAQLNSTQLNSTQLNSAQH